MRIYMYMYVCMYVQVSTPELAEVFSINAIAPAIINARYVMLCYIMLCYVMLCYVMSCYVMLYYVMLCMLCYVLLCYVMLLHDII
jgi:hypothetical protein